MTCGVPPPSLLPPLSSRKMAKVTERYDVTWEGNFGRGGSRKTQSPEKWFRIPRIPGKIRTPWCPPPGSSPSTGRTEWRLGLVPSWAWPRFAAYRVAFAGLYTDPPDSLRTGSVVFRLGGRRNTGLRLSHSMWFLGGVEEAGSMC